jgi:hypothetical protein
MKQVTARKINIVRVFTLERLHIAEKTTKKCSLFRILRQISNKELLRQT